MSATSAKGNEGEAGIVDFLNLWFPYSHIGGGVCIRESNGIKDVGDIHGVIDTCIEAKNYTKPQLGSFMTNGEKKADNGNRSHLFVVYKRSGFSRKRSGAWSACSTVRHLLNADLHDDFDGSTAFTTADVPLLCADSCDLVVRPGIRYEFLQPSPEPWRVKLMFRPNKTAVQERADELILDHVEHDGEDDPFLIPMVVNPRTDSPDEVGRWYVYTTLYYAACYLESIGLLPRYLGADTDSQERPLLV